MKIRDLTNQSFGRLIVLKYQESRNWRAYWYCKCQCGQYKVCSGHDLVGGKILSCGCLMKEVAAKNAKGMHLKSSQNVRDPRIWKNGKKHPLWYILAGMKSRCYTPTCRQYRWYGAKGIKICDEWKDSLPSFIEWAESEGWEKGLTIDRVDVNKDYTPENCRFITRSENVRRAVVERHEREKYQRDTERKREIECV